MNPELQQVLKEIQKDRKFSIKHLEFFIKEYNDRFWRSLRNVIAKGVKKYVFSPSNRIVWIVIGNQRDYLIISELYCNCEDFYVKVVIQKTAKLCYHLLSKLLADYLGYYEEIIVEDERYTELMKDWKRF
ncbi:MAG: hypothetical protein ACTSRS_07845 [Candidatus Helarchaeota archaeon]